MEMKSVSVVFSFLVKIFVDVFITISLLFNCIEVQNAKIKVFPSYSISIIEWVFIAVFRSVVCCPGTFLVDSPDSIFMLSHCSRLIFEHVLLLYMLYYFRRLCTYASCFPWWYICSSWFSFCLFVLLLL